jgi:hypothetical protein
MSLKKQEGKLSTHQKDHLRREDGSKKKKKLEERREASSNYPGQRGEEVREKTPLKARPAFNPPVGKDEDDFHHGRS